MQSLAHKQHIASRVSHADCCECRSDNERQFVDGRQWRYQHVHEYLGYIAPRLAAIRDGDQSTDARAWLRGFINALHTRINLKVSDGNGGYSGRSGRKFCDGYLKRLGQFHGERKVQVDAGYLRNFAGRGASCLDYR